MYYPNLIQYIIDSMNDDGHADSAANAVADVPHNVVVAAVEYIKQCEGSAWTPHCWLNNFIAAHVRCRDERIAAMYDEMNKS
jgi:hypothetical protein